MVLKALDSATLDGLCSQDQLDLLDSVDHLRSQGIDHYVSLPQIIVCGDQSSGKSSVLEAISGVAFPVKGTTCTRFPTELILRKHSTVGVSVSIVPHHSHTEQERDALGKFRETLDRFDELPELVEKAKKAMAIGSFGRAFSNDLLRIEVSGPERPHLTIVDLPGLIHSETKQLSAADVELVQDVVKSYMDEPRSIILAVVSAKNDVNNQIVLKLARNADKLGTRTLGVITKPDMLISGSDSEATYISLAKNLEVEFRLGWHVLKNMDSEIGSWSLKKRDEDEEQFFTRGRWMSLPPSVLGIGHLRVRLSKLLLGQIAAELPSLIEEIELKSDACHKQLEKLGQPRATLHEQRLYLLTLSQSCQSLIKAAVDGTYNDSFFGDPKTPDGYGKRIRAVVQNINQGFADRLTDRGHTYSITDARHEKNTSSASSTAKSLTRVQFLDRVEDLIKRTRGRELPGTFNPMIISDLFMEQSQPWEKITQRHIAAVVSAVKSFLKHLVRHVADASTSSALYHTLIAPALEEMVKNLKKKTSELLAEHQHGHPITYNHYFTETIQKVRQDRNREEFTRIIQDFFGIDSLEGNQSQRYHQSSYRPLLDSLMAQNEPDMNRHACSEALDCMQAYYKVALKRFVDDMAVEAVETTILSKLEGILSPVKVSMLENDVVKSIAGESEESGEKRRQLTSQLQILRSGSETCRRFMIGKTRDMTMRQGPSDQLSALLASGSLHGDLGDSDNEEQTDSAVVYVPNIDIHQEPEIVPKLTFGSVVEPEPPTPEPVAEPEPEPAAEEPEPEPVAEEPEPPTHEPVVVDNEWGSFAVYPTSKKKSKKSRRYEEPHPVVEEF